MIKRPITRKGHCFLSSMLASSAWLRPMAAIWTLDIFGSPRLRAKPCSPGWSEAKPGVTKKYKREPALAGDRKADTTYRHQGLSRSNNLGLAMEYLSPAVAGSNCFCFPKSPGFASLHPGLHAFARL